MGFLAGKRALIVGLATERSIACGIASAMHREGAELAFTYQGERLKDRVVEMAAAFGSKVMMPLDVASDAEIDAAFAQLRETWDSLDILVHAVAFAPREALAGGFVDSTSREVVPDGARHLELQPHRARPRQPAADAGPRRLDRDALLPRRRALDPELQRDGPGQGEPRGERALPRADLGPRGIRVNAISAGPIKTLAAAGSERVPQDAHPGRR